MRRFIHIALFSLIIVGSSSCTKEQENLITVEETLYDTLRTLPVNRIIEYNVTNIDETTIYSAIDDSKKTITVYLPAYYMLGIIQPEIVLPEGTAISPTADEPVPVFSEAPFTYEVTSPAGEKATYTLNIIVQQQDFTINELTTNINSPRTLPNAGGTITVQGRGMLGNQVVTKGFLMDEDGNEVYAFADVGNVPAFSYQVHFGWGSSFNKPPLEPGLYWVEVRSYALTKRMTNPVRVQ
ncbi:hypothetical protein [Sphingobacterium corticibacterium]|uniref:DUF5018 domain-containing protein n=1 Tax=Sphingobacterium corticibacterium TaxID=2484746 RepID=A0A4Q6XTP1_9SPHI|nr:hypothetical protein [Sphingobacterium corticibacterium]RZF59706.1 hypothetical protein EWE74_11155 [Sphingobacterium corticibacterium]